MTMDPQPFKNPKVPLIIDCALAIMKEKGDQGLTMRQVAARAGISLSNVQYYFKNKNELLKGMVDFYCAKCAALSEERMAESGAATPRERLRELIAYNLDQGDDRAEIYRIFRELWAIAGRNEEIDAHLKAYYAAWAEMLSELVAPLAVHPDAISRAVSLLLPYIEGYGVMASVIPLDTEQVTRMLTDTLFSLLEGESGLPSQAPAQEK